MAEEAVKQKEMDLGPFTKEERAYFDSKGEQPIPVASPPTGDVATPPAQTPAPPDGVPPPAEPVSSAEAAPEKPTHVPVATLQEERKRRQDAEEKARQIELLNARMEERFRAFRDAMTPRQQAAQPPPDPNRDIFGAVSHMQAEQRATRAEIDNYKRQIQAEDQLKQLQDWGRNAEHAYVQQNPDYYQALHHLRQTRARELQVWGMSPSAIGDQLKHEENQLLARAAQERRNPAEMAHALAKQRGYGAAPPPPQPPQPGKPVAANPQAYVDLDRIAAGQQQSGTLSTVGGSAATGSDLEPGEILRMSDGEFANYIAKHPAHWRRMRGAAH